MTAAFLEVTEWGDEFPNINHVYLLNDDKMIAYWRRGSDKPFYFSKPIIISKGKRKFRKLEVNPFNEAPEEEVSPALVKVAGSKGETYYVDPVEKTCTCQGFKWRGKCKHVDTVVPA